MRFLGNGPLIPDDLLIARDEGRAIFFCGAGVSRACAGLPNFFELAQRVMDSLGSLPESPSRKLVTAARKMEPFDDVGAQISADRVFGLLEREFRTQDIEAAVAAALRPSADVDLSAHRILVKLGRGPDRKVRLVTTNFDLLFETCDRRLARWKPPNLPDPRRDNDFNGIIHLHGHVTDSYDGAVGDRFVLSSAEFGRAYLSEGWATQFIRAVMERYLVVFVGYSADDPPVQYLLEALNRSPAAAQQGLYAFQPGSESDAVARWRHKGVRPIAYDDSDGHRMLWEALEAWAERAKNPGAWADRLVRRAFSGPQALMPHERGQVVHLVSTPEGAKKFASAKRPPPASWLCAFDPAIRYAQPGKRSISHGGSIYFDPFEEYGLDSDPVPAKIEPNNSFARRDIPSGVRDVFAATDRDRAGLQDFSFPKLRGYLATNTPELPSRLGHLGNWLARAADDPVSVWWAAGQSGLHPGIQAQITFELWRSRAKNRALARRAWRFLFEAWRSRRQGSPMAAHWLKQSIDRDGWTATTVRDYGELLCPYIKVSRSLWSGPQPPAGNTRIRLSDMVNIHVEYPHDDMGIESPDEQLKHVVPAVRRNLELGVALEAELGNFAFHGICPIEADPELPGESAERNSGISRNVVFYVKLFRRLLQRDSSAAKDECAKWPSDEHVVFARLRFWACGFPEIMSDAEASAVLTSLPEQVFWGSRHQRDLLLVLAKRWATLSATARETLEKRLLAGPARRRWQNREEFCRYRAWAVLERLYWLHDHACSFTFNVDAKAAPYRAVVPEWEPGEAKKAAASREARGGFVRTDISYADLLNEPLAILLQKAFERQAQEQGMLLRRDPFAGFVAERPIRALGALRYAGWTNAHCSLGWQTFLNSQARRTDKPRLAMLIARRLVNLPISFVATFSNAATSWLAQARELLCPKYEPAFYAIFDKLAAMLLDEGSAEGSRGVRSGHERDWSTEAINSAAGNLAEALLGDPTLTGLTVGTGLPAQWVERARALSGLPGDSGRYALVLFARQINWFYAIDPAWTEANLLAPMRSEGDASDAVLDGFFWHPEISSALYARLKPTLLWLATSPKPTGRRHKEVLSNLLLCGWTLRDEQTGTRWTTSDELKSVLVNGDDDFRTQTLWQVAHWPQAEEKVSLLTEVWPKQIAARSPRVTAGLCDIPFDDEENFEVLVAAILPLVSTLEDRTLVVPSMRHPDSTILERYPQKALALLWAVLPQDATNWPYGAGDALLRICSTEGSLLHDHRMIELLRRWNKH